MTTTPTTHISGPTLVKVHEVDAKGRETVVYLDAPNGVSVSVTDGALHLSGTRDHASWAPGHWATFYATRKETAHHA